MIFQLMRLDPSWKTVPLMTVAYVLLSCMLFRFNGFSDPQFSSIPVMIVIGAVVFCKAEIRTTSFQISLPLSARQLFLARISSILAVLWVPPAAACVVLVLQGSSGPKVATQLLEVTSLLTLIILVVRSIRVREMQVLGSRVTHAILFVALIVWLGYEQDLPALPVLMISLSASAVVFCYIWKNIPGSFQFAPKEASGKSAAANAISSQRNIPHSFQLQKWLPILRSIFSWLYLIWLPLFFLMLGFGSPFTCLFFAIMLWVATRQRIRWLSVLPFSRSAILAVYIIPILLSLVGGHFLEALRGPLRKSPYGIYVIRTRPGR